MPPESFGPNDARESPVLGSGRIPTDEEMGRRQSTATADENTETSGSWAWQWIRPASRNRNSSSSSLDRRRSVLNSWRLPSARYSAGWEGIEAVTQFFSSRLNKMNAWGDRSWIGRFFTFRDRQARLGKELHAGLISFLMIVYTLTVNPQIISTTGGTCDAESLCDPDLYKLFGKDCLYVSGNGEAVDCILNFRRSVTTATAVASLIASFMIGFFANLPMGLAPGIGINVYFAYQVVGQDVLTYGQALVAIFIEGWIFIVLSLTGVRGLVMKHMPTSIAFSGSVGMGLLLAYTGLRSLGVIAFDGTTLTTLGGCSRSERRYVYTSNVSLAQVFLGPEQPNVDGFESSTGLGTFNMSAELLEQSSAQVFACEGREMRSPTMWLGIAGGILSSLLLAWRVKGALFWGVLFVTVIAWIPGHAASYLGAGSPIPGGELRLQNFERVVAAPSLDGSGLQWDWSGVSKGQFWFVLFTFLYIDILDTTGILLSMALLLDSQMEMDYYGVDDHDEIKEKKEAIKEANDGVEPNPYQQFVSHNKEFKGQQWAFLSDGVGIIVSSMVGISPVGVYLESAAGIEEGGRTGIVSLVVSFFFFVALFFSPILSSIPAYATGSALILVGIMLMAHADHIPWDEPKDSIPAFLTIIVMPLTYSVAYGILAGLVMYVILRLPDLGVELFKRARYKIREYRGDDLVADDTVSVASSKKSGKGRAAHRKVFGELSYRSDSLSNFGAGSEPFQRDQFVTSTAEVIPIPRGAEPGRQLAHSQSHAGFSPSWDAGLGGAGSSPGGGMLSGYDRYERERYGSPSTARPTFRRTSGTEVVAVPGSAGMRFPTLQNSLKKSASFAVMHEPQNVGTSNTSADAEAGGLFGNFQMLDLDLGGSGSSEDGDAEEEIMMNNDGTLGLVSRKSLQRQSTDMSMFNQRRTTADMEVIEEPPAPGQAGQVTVSNDGGAHASRRITFSNFSRDSELAAGSVETAGIQTSATARSLSRQTTNRSMSQGSESSLGGLSRSFSQSTSFQSRGMARTESAAALRLKDLFANADAHDDDDDDNLK